MYVYLVRHGETEWNKDGVFRGVTDFPLSEKGRSEARLTGAWFRAKGIERVFSGPLSRASETAGIIGEAVGRPVTVLDEFTDMAFGRWEGLTVEEVERHYPGDYGLWQSAPQRLNIEGGERLGRVRRRAMMGFMKAISPEPDGGTGNVVIVTHRVVLKVLTLALLRVPDSRFWSIRYEPCSITMVERKEGVHTFHFLNDTCHLSGLKEEG